MSEETATITRSRAITLINNSIDNFATFYDCYCYRNEAHLSQEQKELYERMNEALYIVRKDEKYRNDLEHMPQEDLTAFLLSCKEMAENHDLLVKFCYPKGKIVIVEDGNTNLQLIEKSLEKLAQYGDVKITNAIKEYHNGERTIRFSNMPKNQYGKTVRINDRYSHFITEQFNRNTPENQVLLAITLAHEFKRNATSDTIEAETRDLILDDTKIIELFALSYGEGIYKKFPEYGILHYIKKIFGETELKDFADYAFDSSGSYWKVNDKGDLLDDGNVSQVKDINDNVIYSGSKGRQGTLQEWLGSANAFTALMQPAGYEWNDTEKKWTKNPGKITHNVIEQAYKDGKLTDDQYNLIRCAAGLVAAKDEKSKKLSLFEQVMSDIQKTNQINTQIRVDLVHRTWEWIKKKWDAVKAKISTDKENPNVAINENEQQINSKSMEELKLSASRVSNRIPQNDLRPDKPNGPCYFRSLLAAIEEKIGKAYELNEIDDIAKICWNENNKYLGDADDKYTVINPTKILETALSYSGYKNAKIIYSVRSSSISGNSDYSIRFIKAKNHFQLGDSNGNLLWEPYKYNNESNSFKGKADLYNEITMTLGEKTE